MQPPTESRMRELTKAKNASGPNGRVRTWYEPRLYGLGSFEQDFIEAIIKDGKIYWGVLGRKVSEPRGPWTYRDVKSAFFYKLLDLGLLSFDPDWNYLVMTGDEFGCNPYLGGTHLYFTMRKDALEYGKAVYASRDTTVRVFRLEPAGKTKAKR